MCVLYVWKISISIFIFHVASRKDQKPKSPIATVKFSSFPQKILYSTKVGFGSQIIGSAKKDIFVFLLNRICNLHFCIFAVRAFVRSFFCFCSSVRVLSAVRSEAVRRRNFFAVRSFIHPFIVRRRVCKANSCFRAGGVIALN